MKKTAAAALIGTMVLALGIGSVSVPADEKWNRGDTSVTSEIDEISIGWASGKVDVLYGEGDAITIETTPADLDEDDKAEWRVAGTELKIREKPEFKMFNFFSPEKTLTVTVPKGRIMKELSIDVASGKVFSEINADELELDCASGSHEIVLTEPAKKIRFDAASGSLLLTAPKAENLDLDLSSGSADFTVAEVGEFEISIASGNITGRMSSFSEGSIDASSGDVDLWLPASAGFTASVDQASGDFSSDLAMKVQGKKYVFGDGSGSLDIDTASGDVVIHEAR